MKLVSFGVTSIQKGRRISLDDSLLKNLSIKVGDQVEIFLDTEEEAVVVKKAQNPPSEVKLGRRGNQKAKRVREKSS